MNNIFTQHVCPDCLQHLENGEPANQKATDTLNKWANDGYTPAGMADDCESFFSFYRCDLCDQLPGDRFKYHFIQQIHES